MFEVEEKCDISKAKLLTMNILHLKNNTMAVEAVVAQTQGHKDVTISRKCIIMYYYLLIFPCHRSGITVQAQ